MDRFWFLPFQPDPSLSYPSHPQVTNSMPIAVILRVANEWGAKRSLILLAGWPEGINETLSHHPKPRRDLQFFLGFRQVR